jgi:hypothetical protein
VATSAELNLLTVKELGLLAKEIAIAGWHEMRKEELVRALVIKSRSKLGSEIIKKRLTPAKEGTVKASVQSKPSLEPKAKTAPTKSASTPASSKFSDEKKKETSPKKDAGQQRQPTSGTSGIAAAFPAFQGKQGLRRDLSTKLEAGHPDRLVLLVRDPFWLHAFWEISTKTMDRAKVALGHFWYTSIPVLRLFRLESDGSTTPRRQMVRDIPIHGGVSNWYLDVTNPPSAFLVELGYLTREKKFHPIVSSNTVETPQQHVIDELDKLDGNWRGVANDLGRVFKLSSGEGNNQELKQVLEEKLGRPMSAQLLSVSQQGGRLVKAQRNFKFSIDADVIVHGKTDPNVQVSIRNEPVKINSDGTFSVRFALPEKRHLFPIEAEGSDGIEMQRVILTVERNTRVLETLIQEPSSDE